jgi:hypothetical protein
MATKGSVKFTIGADASGLGRGLRGAEKHMKTFGQKVESLSKFGGSGLAGVAGGLMSIGGAAEFVRESASATMSLYKSTLLLSRVTGFDTQTSSAWVSLAKERGISTETLARSYTGLAKQIKSAQQGGKSATTTFAALGISQRDLARGDTAQIVGKIADAFQSHADGSSKAALASQLFGRNYAGMLGILNRGGAGVRKLIKEQVEHGAVLRGNTRDLQKARESQLRFGMALEKLKVTIGQAVLPIITKFTDKFTGWLDKAGSKKKIGELVSVFQQLGTQVMAVAGVLVPMISRVSKFVGQHKGLVTLIADVVAFRLAVKLISFAVPLKGLGKFAGKVLGLRSVGIRAGAGMAAGIASKFPALATWMASAFEKLGAQMGWRFASRFGQQLAGKETAAAAGGGGLLGMLGRGLKTVGKVGLGIATTGLGLAAAGLTAGLAVFNGTADDGTENVASSTRDALAYSHARGMYKGRHYSTVASWLRAKRAASKPGKVAGGSISDSLGALPDFGFSAPTEAPKSARPSSPKKGKNSPDSILTAATKLAQWSHRFDEQLSTSSNSLWAKGIDPNSPKGLAQKTAILTAAISAWPKVRAALAALAAQAHHEGHHATVVKIHDYIHRGDLKQLEYRAHLQQAKARGKATTPAAKVPAISASQLSEEAFIRAAFGPGDIGSGGLNAWLAAGGAPNGMNQVKGSNSVNITIQTLHPGDGQTKSAIAQTVVAAFHGQGTKQKARQTVGGK